VLGALKMHRERGTVFTGLKAIERDFVLASMLDLERGRPRDRTQRTKAKRVGDSHGVSRQTVDRAAKRLKDGGFNRGRLSQ
jgi:hypothetical protein